jgi:hypothetical protein
MLAAIGRSRHVPPPSMAGTLEDTVAVALKNAIMGGTPGSAAAKDRALFYSDVLSRTATKFVVTPEGKQTIQSLSWSVALPAFAIGLGVGYLLWKRAR